MDKMVDQISTETDLSRKKVEGKEPEPVYFWLDIIGQDGKPTGGLAKLPQGRFLGGGNVGKIYLAEVDPEYVTGDVELPQQVAIKVAKPGQDKVNEQAVQKLLKIRQTITRDRPGAMAFPRILGVTDRPYLSPYYYAMELVNPEFYGGIYTTQAQTDVVNNLITMLVTYADAVEIMFDANVAQVDRDYTDVIWWDYGKKLKILDWDMQGSVSDMEEEWVIERETFMIEEIIRRLLRMPGIKVGSRFSETEQLKEIEALRSTLPEPVFNLVSLVLSRKLPANRETLEKIKLAALMLREKLKDEALDLITYTLERLQERLKIVKDCIDNRHLAWSQWLPRKLVEANKHSREEFDREAIWKIAKTEMAIYLQAQEYLHSRGNHSRRQFDVELARILDEKSGQTLAWKQIVSELRKKAGGEALKGAPSITCFDPASLSRDVLWCLFDLVEEQIRKEAD